MQYSRNLGTGDGIELVRLDATTDAPTAERLLASSCAPNPFNPRTTIRFELPASGRVELMVYDLTGGRIAELVNEHRERGSHDVVWEGKDDAGRALPSGTYVYRLRQGALRDAGKMILVR